MVGIFFLVVLLTLALIFWPRKTKEEELEGSLAKKVCKSYCRSCPITSHLSPLPPKLDRVPNQNHANITSTSTLGKGMPSVQVLFVSGQQWILRQLLWSSSQTSLHSMSKLDKFLHMQRQIFKRNKQRIFWKFGYALAMLCRLAHRCPSWKPERGCSQTNDMCFVTLL